MTDTSQEDEFVAPGEIVFTRVATHYWYDGPQLATYRDQADELWLGMALAPMPSRPWPVIMVPWKHFDAPELHACSSEAAEDDKELLMAVECRREFQNATVAYLWDFANNIPGEDVIRYPTPLSDNECCGGDLWLPDQRIAVTPCEQWDK